MTHSSESGNNEEDSDEEDDWIYVGSFHEILVWSCVRRMFYLH